MDKSRKEELERAVRQLLACNSEEEQDALFHRISALSPDPEWSDYIFHSREFEDETGALDVSGVVEKIAAYRLILL